MKINTYWIWPRSKATASQISYQNLSVLQSFYVLTWEKVFTYHSQYFPAEHAQRGQMSLWSVKLLCCAGLSKTQRKTFISGGKSWNRFRAWKTEIVGLSEGNVSQWNEHPRMHPAPPPDWAVSFFPHRNPIILHFGVCTPLAMQHPWRRSLQL